MSPPVFVRASSGAAYRLVDVAGKATIESVASEVGVRVGRGEGLYQLAKKEDISDGKALLLRVGSGSVYVDGNEARKRLGLSGKSNSLTPAQVEAKCGAGAVLWVQSTSANRALTPGTQLALQGAAADAPSAAQPAAAAAAAAAAAGPSPVAARPKPGVRKGPSQSKSALAAEEEEEEDAEEEDSKPPAKKPRGGRATSVRDAPAAAASHTPPVPSKRKKAAKEEDDEPAEEEEEEEAAAAAAAAAAAEEDPDEAEAMDDDDDDEEDSSSRKKKTARGSQSKAKSKASSSSSSSSSGGGGAGGGVARMCGSDGVSSFAFVRVSAKSTVSALLSSAGLSAAVSFYEVGSKKESISAGKELALLLGEEPAEGSSELCNDSATVRKMLGMAAAGTVSIDARSVTAKLKSRGVTACLFVQSSSANRALLPDSLLCVREQQPFASAVQQQLAPSAAVIVPAWARLQLPSGAGGFQSVPLGLRPDGVAILPVGKRHISDGEESDELTGSVSGEEPYRMVLPPMCAVLVKAAAQLTAEQLEVLSSNRSYNTSKLDQIIASLPRCPDQSRAHLCAFSHPGMCYTNHATLTRFDLADICATLQISAQARGWRMAREAMGRKPAPSVVAAAAAAAAASASAAAAPRLDAPQASLISALNASDAFHGSTDIAGLIAGMTDESSDTRTYASRWVPIFKGEKVEAKGQSQCGLEPKRAPAGSLASMPTVAYEYTTRTHPQVCVALLLCMCSPVLCAQKRSFLARACLLPKQRLLPPSPCSVPRCSVCLLARPLPSAANSSGAATAMPSTHVPRVIQTSRTQTIHTGS